MGHFSIWELLIVLAIVILLFGTKKLRNIGSDLGGALKSFRKAIKEEEVETPPDESASSSGNVIEGDADSSPAKGDKES